jgi:hypothetical protein
VAVSLSRVVDFSGIEAAGRHQERNYKPAMAPDRTKSLTIPCNPKQPPQPTMSDVIPMMTDEEEEEFMELNHDFATNTEPAIMSVVKGMRIR